VSPRTILPGVRAAWGTALMVAPAPILRRCGNPPGRAIRAGARALGARHLGEALLQRRRRSADARAIFRAVDLAHGATMALLAARSRRYRAPALVSLTISLTLACGD
jgi:hypothetical protein